ncbi:hypothetical protein CCR78_02040 [Rhodovulum imhoffii]|nr:hypothetical protein [Rhodovulum imhoffii]
MHASLTSPSPGRAFRRPEIGLEETTILIEKRLRPQSLPDLTSGSEEKPSPSFGLAFGYPRFQRF